MGQLNQWLQDLALATLVQLPVKGRATSSTLRLPSMLCYFFHAEERQGAPYILMQEAILTNNLDKNNSPISVPTVVWGELGPVCSLI